MAEPVAGASHQRAVGPWLLDEEIGAGSFAVVWRAHHSATGAAAAVKEINTDKLNRKLQESLASEVAVLNQTKHDNIVRLLDLLKDGNRIYIVLEYCTGGDLGHYIRRYGRVSEPTARYFLQQLAEGLKELRKHNVIHRDLKPQNLLLSDTSAHPLLKIADFGFARSLAPQGLAETLCGSPLYMAPEILQFHKYDAKADLWSIGTILFELLTGKPPFTGANHVQLLHNIERGAAKLPDALAARLSPACVALMQQLLKRNPVERITFEEFFAHPFLTQGGAVGGAGGGGRGGCSAGVPPSLHGSAPGVQWPVQQRPMAAAVRGAGVGGAGSSGGAAAVQAAAEQLQTQAHQAQPMSMPKQQQLPVQALTTQAQPQYQPAAQPAAQQPSTQQQPLPPPPQQQQAAVSSAIELSDLIERDYVVVQRPLAAGLPPPTSPASSKGMGSSKGTASTANAASPSLSLQQQQQRAHVGSPASRLSTATGPATPGGIGETLQPGQAMDMAARALALERRQQQQERQRRQQRQRLHQQRHVVGGEAGVSNAQLLAQVLMALAEVACAGQQEQGMDVQQQEQQQQQQRHVAEYLAAQLLGLRLLDILCQPDQQQQQEGGGKQGAAAAVPHVLADAQAEDMEVLQEAAAQLLGSVAQRLKQEQEQQSSRPERELALVLPNAAELLYEKALGSCRAGAAAEVMGSWDSGAVLYAQAADLLLFLSKDWPQLSAAVQLLVPEERASMQRLYYAVRGRLAACAASAAASGSSAALAV